MVWDEAKSKAEVTLPRVCTVPHLSSETVAPTDAPSVRPSFDGYNLARRLDKGDTDRVYASNKRARDVSRGRDESESRSRSTTRRRESISSTSRGRDRGSTKKSSSPEDPLEWLRLDHERLALRAEAIAKQRKDSANLSAVAANTSAISSVPSTPVNPPPSDLPPVISRDHSSAKKSESRRADSMTPSSLNLSEITISMSDLGSAHDESSPMDIDPSNDSQTDIDKEEDALLDPK